MSASLLAAAAAAATPVESPADTQPPADIGTAEPVAYEVDGAKFSVPPDFLREGRLNEAAVLKAYTEVTEQRAATAPPEAYVISIAPEIQQVLAAGGDLAIDPVFQGFSAKAKAAGMSQAQFDEVISWAGELVAAQPSEMEAAQAQARESELAALKGLYGAKTGETLASLAAYGEKIRSDHGQDMGAVIDSLTSTAAGVRFLDLVRTGKIPAGLSGNLPGAAAQAEGGGTVSEEEIRALMKDPKYYRDHDPATIAKVNAGWKALYPA